MLETGLPCLSLPVGMLQKRKVKDDLVQLLCKHANYSLSSKHTYAIFGSGRIFIFEMFLQDVPGVFRIACRK